MSIPLWISFLAVGLGSGLGAVTRAACSWSLGSEFAGGGLPWATLLVNTLGSGFIGLYARLTEPDGRWAHSPALRQFVLVGFCGGFTTFSIFSLETLWLIQQGEWPWAAATLGISLLLWLLAVWLGYLWGQSLSDYFQQGD